MHSDPACDLIDIIHTEIAAMAHYKADESYQNKFIPVNFEQQIIPGTFEYALAHIIDNHLDLTSFDQWYNNDTGGASAYPPSVMLKIILFAYSRGLISSRRIALAYRTNITFMSLSGDIQPHYTSIAAFVAKMHHQLEPLFTQILMICDKEDLIGRNMFAIDGCKIASNASKEWSGTFDELERKETKLRRASKRILERHQAQDELTEDEVEHDLQQKEKLDKSADKIKQFLASHEEKTGSRGTPVKSNITDPDSAKMTTSKGIIQGYNGIAISDDKHQIILQAPLCLSELWLCRRTTNLKACACYFMPVLLVLLLVLPGFLGWAGRTNSVLIRWCQKHYILLSYIIQRHFDNSMIEMRLSSIYTGDK